MGKLVDNVSNPRLKFLASRMDGDRNTSKKEKVTEFVTLYRH